MKFCINIEDPLQSICYRLQLDNSWQPCSDPTVLSENDFTSTERHVILAKQIANEIITIDNKEYTINPDSEQGIDFSAMENLHYEVYCFRDSYPSLPQRKQLEQTLVKGDDTLNNTLILKTDGQFYLVRPDQIIFQKVDPNIVCQFGGFIAGSGFVGSGINDDKFESYTDDYFRTGMHYWRDHLVEKKIHVHEIEGATLDNLDDIYMELKKIEW